jgi:hypothetical protein
VSIILDITIQLARSGGHSPKLKEEEWVLRAASPPSAPISPLLAAGEMSRQKRLNRSPITKG